ncbi:NACHT domain-containing protein [Nostoc sp. CCY 9925]|uniref:NACHT domain-containing protein n=1 Tax=Nostoc sp. CCY 9925 TaxID=3103865 RepID=UPI0039C6EE63
MPDSQDPKQVNNNDLRNAQFGGGFINAENVNAGKIGGDIWNIFFGQQTAPVGNPARPKNERILLAAVKEELTARLRQSLHNAVLINLGKESQPQQVKRPWDAEIKIGQKPSETLPDTTTILEVFDSQEVAGKLLILGAPGSGKTTTQLELAQALVNRAEEQFDYPVPVLFNLSSWKVNRQSITDWLVAELKSKYGASKKLGQEWLKNRQLLPLLDDLDELEPQRQELCIHAINQFLASETRPLSLVVCSRSEEYSNYSTQLQLNGAIYLQPLTNNQICDYLTAINCIELWSTLSNDLDLLELVTTPLLLNITVLASQEISVKEWQHLNSTADQIQYLLDAYVGRMLTRDTNNRLYLKNKTPNARQTRMWLVWLAQKMLLESKTEFLIEEIQPYWLKYRTQKWIYKFIVWLIVSISSGLSGLIINGLISGIILGLSWGSILGVFFGITSGLIVGLGYGFISGLILGLLLGILAAADKEIKTIEFLKWSWKKTKSQMIIIGIFTLITGLIFGLVSGLFFGLSIWSFFGLSNSNIKRKTIPNQGIKKSSVNARIFWLAGGLAGGLLVGLIYGLVKGLITGLSGGLLFMLGGGLEVGITVGLIGGVIGGLFGGGITCIQHFTLRLILYCNGHIPWNYARFLDYCTERMLLQRVGGRYRFIHKLLQDHFAQMEFKRD